MTQEWIPLDAALAWLRQAYRLPLAVAENALREAWESCNVPMQEHPTRVIREPNGEFRAEYIAPTFGPLGIRQEPELKLEELRWQIEQQLGEPPASEPKTSQIVGASVAETAPTVAEPGSSIEAPRRPVGRPTQEAQICAAFEDLKRLGKIDFAQPMTSIYPEIRRMITGGTASTPGLGDEAIRKQISPRWPH